MIYPQDFESKIGFDTVRTALLGFCTSRLGKEEVEAMKFSTDFDAIVNSLHSVDEMMRIKKGGFPYPTPSAHDVLPFLSEIKARNSFMSAERLYKLMSVMLSFSEIESFFRDQREEESETPLFPSLTKEVETLRAFPDLVKVISNAINKFGELKDTASPELYEIRQQIRSASGAMQRAMRRVLDSAVAQGIVDKDTTPSIRDGRLVIPVQAGSKRQISGIVHDESATGKTVFIEPAQVVEAGNRIKQLEMEERREEIAILTRIADVIRPNIEDISSSCYLMGRLDFIAAKAAFAIDTDARMPHLSKNVQLEYYHAVHPALSLALRQLGRDVVPLNITLSPDKRILIISGPNAGGKSVCLKTVAVVQYMFQCGMMPTVYENSHLGIFKNLFIDIGDEQSIENDLSTYSSHLRNMKFFLANADKRTLFLADEMGSGTEPQIGGAMAQAILDYIGKAGSYGVVTTHYQNLKKFAEEAPGFVNGAMLYDRQHLAPTFQLSIGNPGSSFALDIAYKLGLPRNVIDEAKQIVGEDYVNLDKYLSDIARDRKYWASKRQNIREKEARLDNLLSNYEEVAGDLKQQRRAILDDARKEAKEILGEANARIERTILEIRNAQAEKERTKELRKDLNAYIDASADTGDDAADKNLPSQLQPLKHKSRKKRTEPKPQAPVAEKREIRKDDYVRLKDSQTVGQVLTISGKKATVAFGALRTIVELSKLELAKKPKESALTSVSSISSSTSDDSRRRQLSFKNEIDVRGMRADEAIQAVTYFLDDAIQFQASRVRILHGTGHGILKTLIRQQLKANTAVAHFEDEDVRFGGAGITVVDLE